MFDQRTKPIATNESGLPPATEPPSDNAPASRMRRGLLKAAATAAPVIATLPSGEALANASTLNCVIAEQDGSKPSPQPVTSSADEYARFLGKIQLWVWTITTSGGDLQQTAIIYEMRIPDSGGVDKLVRVYGQGNPDTLPAAGTWFDPPSGAQMVPGLNLDAYFLYSYKTTQNPIMSNDDVLINEVTLLPDDCTLSDVFDDPANLWPGSSVDPDFADGPQVPEHCIFPMAIRVDAGEAGNTAITNSCLMSFQRTF